MKRKLYDELDGMEFDVDKAALENVQHMIDSMIDRNFDGKDWVEMMVECARDANQKCERHVTQAQRALDDLLKLRGAVVSTGDLPDIFQSRFDAKLQARTEALNNAKAVLASGVRTLEIVEQLKPGAEFMESWERARSGPQSAYMDLMRANQYMLSHRKGGFFSDF